MSEQAPLWGESVDEATVYVGLVKDDGTREVFVSLAHGRRRVQTRKRVADWVATSDVLGTIGLVLWEVEKGQLRLHEFPVALEAALEVAESEPF